MKNMIAHWTKLLPFVAMLAAALTAPIPLFAQARTLDTVLAVVNGEPVTRSQIDRREKFQRIEYKRQGIAAPNEAVLRAQLLENAVLETLLLQIAKQERLVPDNASVNEVAQANAARAGMTFDQLRERLTKDGATLLEYFQDLRDEMAMSRLREREVNERIKVTDAEIDRFLRSPNTGTAQEYNVKQIVLAKSEGMSDKDLLVLKAKAAEIRGKILKGESFATLAKQFSSSSDAQAGGVMGFRLLDKLPEMYSLSVENMSTGGVSDVLESSAGLHILQLEGVRLQTPTIQQTRARHILIRVDGFTNEANALDEIKRIHSLLVLNSTRFPELAKQFSQDPSAQSGGDLGWAVPGDMVAEFDAVMDKTALNEVSAPFRTQFGWHVLQVLEREVRSLTRERLRNQARALLRQRKQEDAMNEWLQEVRAKAFVEYKKAI